MGSTGSLSRNFSTGAVKFVRPIGRDTDQMVADVIAEVASTLWPINTAAEIASRCGCSVRAAERYLGGQREWSGKAVAIVVSEILNRHGMRNVRVTQR